ncbi:hypothetical protein AVEN_134382-1 [Araneus ventricosus]|uniref:Uncharacterized protein n=1 Tax=Araneus ventricosus TaxID=182803 RepID=A0A4Y2I2B3_ARAVE|nr:hypothetical protein AVEN_134382-1 [Araneus ventricosus]
MKRKNLHFVRIIHHTWWLSTYKSSYSPPTETRGEFWDEPRNFGPRLDEEDDAWADTPLSKLPHLTNDRAFGHLRMIQRVPDLIQDGSSVESGFEPGSRRLQSRALTTRPPRPRLRSGG